MPLPAARHGPATALPFPRRRVGPAQHLSGIRNAERGRAEGRKRSRHAGDGPVPGAVPRLPPWPGEPASPAPHHTPARTMPTPTAPALPARLRGDAKQWLRALVPLEVRKRLAVWISRRRWLGGRYWWSTEVVRDLAERDVNAYHHFLWSHHLAYAETYEVERRFGRDRIHPTRHLLFADLLRVLRERGVVPEADVRSVLEVGASMGYLLRHMEEELFPAARTLEGIDIDEYAVRAGTEHLRRLGSRVSLATGDMTALPCLLAGRRFDLVLCAGTLMYLREEDASTVVDAMLRHCSGVVALAGLADPAVDNRELRASGTRERDRTSVHNLDALVERAGGTVVHRRWEGGRTVDGNTVYFVFAVPGVAEAAA